MALTPDEFRKRAPNWSLESDGQLLQYMVSIAKNVESLAAQTRDNLNDLMLTVKQSELKLANATNQFSAVEQVKFVENRVEEDDESFYGLRRRRQQVDEPRTDTAQKQGDERTLDDLIQLAVERSAEGMYRTYEKYPLPLSDSSDDEYPPSVRGTVMHLPPSVLRSLPHVIGSKEWQNSWHVGLDPYENEYDSDRKEEYSESPSETDDGGMFPSQPNSKQHTPSESESSIWGVEGRKRAPSLDPSITGDDGSSVYSFASSSKMPRSLLPAVAGRGIPADVSARLKPPSLFPEEPPEEKAVRSKGDRGLFDDSPEEDEPPTMPTPTPQPRQTAPANDTKHQTFFKGNAQQPARKIVNLFDDEPPEEPLPDATAVPEQRKTINLFIESDEDEDVVRENNVRNNNPDRTTVKNRAGPAGVTNPGQMTKLVDELNNNFRKQQPDQAAPDGSRTVPAARPPVVSNNLRPAPKTNLFDDEPPVDEFDQLFQAAYPSERPAQPVRSALPSREKVAVNLFAEDDEDDYDGIVVGSNETKTHKSPLQGAAQNSPGRLTLPKPADRLPAVKKKSIFDDSESDEHDVNEAALLGSSAKAVPSADPTIPKAAPKVKKSIFSDSSEADDDDDEALFGKSSNILKSKLEALKRSGPASKTDGSNAPGSGKSLFDADSDDDVLKPPVASLLLQKAKTSAAKVSLFDDEPPSDDDDTLFGKNATQTRVEDTEKRTEATAEQQSTSNGQLVPSKQSPEPEKSQPVVKEAPTAAATGSIRSMILKKSIFNSDSESDEDDAMFGTTQRVAENEAISTNKPAVTIEDESKKSQAKDKLDIPTQIDVANAEDVEETATTNDNSTQNASESVSHIEKESNSHVSIVADPLVDTATASKDSLFESLAESGGEGASEPPPCDDTEPSSGPTLETAIANSNVVQEEIASNEAIIEGDIEPAKPELEAMPLPDEPAPDRMIANDIDYYLHTNETTPPVEPPITPPAAAKSEPKSALTFSPIGLFDDVPPPDDGDETDDATACNDLHRNLHSVEPSEPTLPPIEDETSPYSAETQSLNFIPTGLPSGNNRSRYLFDDEPPPDEPDNGSAGSSLVVKGLFDSPAPASLPPMVEDSRVDRAVKPTRSKVNKLNSKIAINVAALLPGARRTPAVNISSSPEKLPSVTGSVKEADKKSPQSEDVVGSKKLTGLNKGRARIPTMRKPPSRHSLRAAAMASSSLETANSSKSLEDEDDRIVVGSEGKIEHSEAGLPQVGFDPPQKRPADPFVDRLSASVRNPSKRLVLPDGTEGAKPLPIVSDRKGTAKPATKSLFDDSDSNGEDNDDLFKQLPSAKGVGAVKKSVAPVREATKHVPARSIFGSNDEADEGEDDDLFGTAKKSSIVGQLTGAKTEKRGLFDDDDGDSDGDDDLFGSKSRIVAKAQSQQQQVKQTGRPSLPPTVTRPTTTTTGTGGDDPLADLLADS
ncbi:WASH complex subunit 2 [Anopheles stephensi]|uniref:WASH complex subunit 2 n=1 Tax=Anopheles stephensi TaxID=30069 RepID=UPI001658A0E0|nr:WASH complex subunit 2 [Anopheles stephensi]